MGKQGNNISTKDLILRVASRMFLEKGFTETSAKAICMELNISTGNLTFHYPSKWHMLSEMIKALCDFQDLELQHAVKSGQTPIMSECLKIAAMIAVCDDSAVAKDLYISAYSHPMTLTVIRKNNAVRARTVFGQHCRDWNVDHYAEAETLVSGIEYATILTTEDSAAIDVRIAGALSSIMTLYEVPTEIRRTCIAKVLKMDYRAMGRAYFSQFAQYIEKRFSAVE